MTAPRDDIMKALRVAAADAVIAKSDELGATPEEAAVAVFQLAGTVAAAFVQDEKDVHAGISWVLQNVSGVYAQAKGISLDDASTVIN